MIEGVTITPLMRIADERGMVMHMMKETDRHFSKFGEIYFSTVYPNAIKGWHLHKKMILNYAVVHGMIKLVLFDDRENSITKNEVQEIFIGNDNYCLVTIPANIWNGFKGIGTTTSIIANCATIPHDPEEILRVDPFDNNIPYNWDLKNG
jgi:dTDP-4-dehydrorhamnose 3,5-epimerase